MSAAGTIIFVETLSADFPAIITNGTAQQLVIRFCSYQSDLA
jgi:hypothetical protein